MPKNGKAGKGGKADKAGKEEKAMKVTTGGLPNIQGVPADVHGVPPAQVTTSGLPNIQAVPEIFSDEIALQSIKESSRNKYKLIWEKFKEFFEEPEVFETRKPTEMELMNFFRDQRETKNKASSTLWTTYSMLNSIIKAKYSANLRDLPRLVTLIKSYDTDNKKKAAVFTAEEIRKFCESEELTGPYWEVRKAIAAMAYFGGLRLTETLSLELEKMTLTNKGVDIVHKRAKQRSDKKDTKFTIPGKKTRHGFSFASCVTTYLDNIKQELGIYTGRVFWTGREDRYVKVPMGRNTIAEVPHQIAEFLGKDNPASYTFHSFRRSSATAAADRGATTAQLVDFYGWKSANMANQYISTSKELLATMADKMIPVPDSESEVELSPPKKKKKAKASQESNNSTSSASTNTEEASSSATSTKEEASSRKKKGTTIIIKNVKNFKM